MDKINIRDQYEEYGIYNVKDIISNFPNIYGKKIQDLTSNFLLTKENIISKEEIVNYCINNFNNLKESSIIDKINKEIISTRIRDYSVLYKRINIYKKKGLILINLLLYLENNLPDKKYENLLKELDINHYKSIICGRDTVRILEALNNTIKQYEKYLNKINNLSTYNRINYDNLYMSSTKLYPNPSIISNRDDIDKTSISLTRKKIYTNNSIK